MNLNTRLERLEQRQAVAEPLGGIKTVVYLPMKDGDDEAGTRSGGPRGVSRSRLTPSVVTVIYGRDDDPLAMFDEWLHHQKAACSPKPV